MNDLTSLVVQLSGRVRSVRVARGHVVKYSEEVDKGVIPTVASLTSQLGETTGAVERTYEASKTWRDTLARRRTRRWPTSARPATWSALLGSTASGLALAGPQMIQWIRGLKGATLAQKALNLVMSLNPIGLLVIAIGGAVAAYIYWKDEINAFLKGAWNNFMVGIQKGIDFLRPLASKLGIDLPKSMDKYTFAVDEGTVQTQDVRGGGRRGWWRRVAIAGHDAAGRERGDRATDQ